MRISITIKNYSLLLIYKCITITKVIVFLITYLIDQYANYSKLMNYYLVYFIIVIQSFIVIQNFIVILN
jgi:hypothetical protein